MVVFLNFYSVLAFYLHRVKDECILNPYCVLLFRMCRALMPADDDVDSMSDEAVWETLPVSYKKSIC